MHFHGRKVLNLFYRFDPSARGGGMAPESATAVVGGLGNHVSARSPVHSPHPA